MRSCSVGATLLLVAAWLQPAAPFSAPTASVGRRVGPSPVRAGVLRPRPPQQSPRAGTPEMFGGAGGGGFLGVGTPELVVIGAVAWALLGPKELYRLARQAGEFLGEWQQLGAQARDTFKDAIDSEMREDELKKQAGEPEAPSPFSEFMPDAIKEKAAGIPALADYAKQKDEERAASTAEPPFPDIGPGEWLGDLGREVDEDEKSEMYRKAVAEMGDPVTNRQAFQEQMSGERNKAVLDEFPAELNYDDWAADPLKPDEDLLGTQIAEAENQLATLRAEAKVLALRRSQQQANAERAQKLADEAALEGAEARAAADAADAADATEQVRAEA